jgi:aminopeptidase
LQEDELLDSYARLIIRVGVNLQEKQEMVLNAPIECADFARRVMREAYTAGAHDVTLVWQDEKAAHIRYEMAKKEVFTEFPDWRHALYTDLAEQGAAFVTIHASDPEIFRDIEPEKMTLAQQSAGAALLEYRNRLMENRNSWCIASVPTAGWARKVFPDGTVEEAEQKLWQVILRTVRVKGGQDAVSAWQEHIAFLHKAAAFMNQHDFQFLHYRNSLGTDLVVELPEGHIWAGGSELTAGGVPFVANLPTEEIYTLPKRDGINGVVVAAKPLNYHGNLIEDFRFTFKAGRVVDYKAGRGQKILQELLATDEGADFLGEVALVPYDSPISRSGLLFYNTLFDENASCHLALGKAYPTCLKGGADMDSVTLLQHGVNDSLVHEDFMVGTRDLSIEGTTRSGERITVFKDGNFSLE